jgi:hypothetical protein
VPTPAIRVIRGSSLRNHCSFVPAEGCIPATFNNQAIKKAT